MDLLWYRFADAFEYRPISHFPDKTEISEINYLTARVRWVK